MTEAEVQGGSHQRLGESGRTLPGAPGGRTSRPQLDSGLLVPEPWENTPPWF